MKKLIIIHRDLSDLNTGGRYYLAYTISHFKKKNLNMEVIDWGKFPKKIRNNRLLLILHNLKHYLKQRNRIFSFTNHNLYFYLLVPYFISRMMGNKYGCGCHLTQYNLRKNFFMRWFEFFCEYLFLQGASLLIIPGKAAMQQFEVFHLERKNMVIINPAPNIVSRGNVTFRKQINRLLFAGQVVWRKGLDTLIRALGKLRDLQLHLDVAGLYDEDSKYFKEIKSMIAENGLKNNISFYGYLSPEKLINLYRNADLFVFPSRHETFGIVLMEAMSFGLPVVASAIPTTAEIIKTNINGILYETEDSDALAHAIRKLISDPDLRFTIIQNNLRISKKFRSWKTVGEENLKAILPFLR